ncbi:TPA: hypothetical protein U2K06_002854 [Legionella pneumophila]|nr:hypothetical protein [Legionella pneumophila]
MTRRGRPPKKVSVRPNLVSSWRELVTRDNEVPLTVALDAMNAALQTHYFHHHITDWENGRRKPGYAAINYMMDMVLSVTLAEHNLSQEVVEDIKQKTRIELGVEQ